MYLLEHNSLHVDSIMRLESELSENRANRIRLESLVGETKINESIFESYPFIHLVLYLYVHQNFLATRFRLVIYDEISNEILWTIVPAVVGLILTHLGHILPVHHNQLTAIGFSSSF